GLAGFLAAFSWAAKRSRGAGGSRERNVGSRSGRHVRVAARPRELRGWFTGGGGRRGPPAPGGGGGGGAVHEGREGIGRGFQGEQGGEGVDHEGSEVIGPAFQEEQLC